MTATFRIQKGLDLPISGGPNQQVFNSPPVSRVALVGDDYPGMRPTMLVSEGDTVKAGQPVFADKKTEGVVYTAPSSGKVAAIKRGEKRKFESLVIDVEGDEGIRFASYEDQNLAALGREAVKENLIRSGLWTALRTRPYSKVPAPETVPAALFVTAIDTNPLAADPLVVLEEKQAEFIAGVEVLTTLTDGPVYVCRGPGREVPTEGRTEVQHCVFEGPHPAGLAGTHIHMLMPASESRTVWYVGYQDVVAIGHLFLTGTLLNERVVSLAGPVVKEPRLVRIPLGASLEEVTVDQLSLPEGKLARVVSGSVLSGRESRGTVSYLGRYHNQVSVLLEGREREFLGWLAPGAKKYSILPVFTSAWVGSAKRFFSLDTSTQGSKRAIVPIGMYEQVMPLDIIATPLLKALSVDDSEYAQMLGVLELDEEDLALCTFVDPGKQDFGPMLRRNLTRIELEG